MTQSRRRFVQTAMVASLPLVVPITAKALAPVEVQSGLTGEKDCLINTTRSLADYVGDVFDLKCPNGCVFKARLMSVDLFATSCSSSRPSHIRVETRVVQFQPLAAIDVTDSIYSVRHSKMNTQDLYFKPILDNLGQVEALEAVIN